MSDDFFSKLDATLAAEADKKADDAVAVDAAVEFAKAAISQCLSVTKKYAQELRHRGITMTIEGGATTIRVKMTFEDGARHDLYFGLNRDRKGMEIIKYLSDRDGSAFSATPGTIAFEGRWHLSMFETLLQEHVRDYVEFSKYHRGVA